MTNVVVTGGDGFLGWHTRVLLASRRDYQITSVSRKDWSDLAAAVRDADTVLHLAGANRGADAAVEQGNIDLAIDVAKAVAAAARPVDLIYANSIQSGRDTPYGRGKAAAAEILAAAAGAAGSRMTDLALPNLFGEHGRPAYNSFVATFVQAMIESSEPTITDRDVGLLHAQRAATALVDSIHGSARPDDLRPTLTTVAGVWETLRKFHSIYHREGDIPPLFSDFDVDLFNTYRAGLFPRHCPIRLNPRIDDRGRLVEVVRLHGGTGQTFVSTSRPGVTRGEHFHRRKIERFVVLAGQARIGLRRCLTDDVVQFDVSGDDPSAVDMPTMWVHNITNTGSTELVTLFWTNELFDPSAPDTHPEPVADNG